MAAKKWRGRSFCCTASAARPRTGSRLRSSLEKDFAVRALDLPGSPRGPGPGTGYEPEPLARWVLGEIDKEPVLLAGHSLGGRVAGRGRGGGARARPHSRPRARLSARLGAVRPDRPSQVDGDVTARGHRERAGKLAQKRRGLRLLGGRAGARRLRRADRCRADGAPARRGRPGHREDSWTASLRPARSRRDSPGRRCRSSS